MSRGYINDQGEFVRPTNTESYEGSTSSFDGITRVTSTLYIMALGFTIISVLVSINNDESWLHIIGFVLMMFGGTFAIGAAYEALASKDGLIMIIFFIASSLFGGKLAFSKLEIKDIVEPIGNLGGKLGFSKVEIVSALSGGVTETIIMGVVVIGAGILVGAAGAFIGAIIEEFNEEKVWAD